MAGENGVHDNANEANEVIWTCKGCKVKSNNKRRNKMSWIECAGCEGTFETKCQNISEAQYTALQERNDILWLCPECLIIMCPKSGTISSTNLPLQTIQEIEDDDTPSSHELMKQIKLIQHKMDSASDIQAAMKGTLDSLQNDVLESLPTDIKEQVDKKIDLTERRIHDKITEVSSQLPSTQGRSWTDILEATASTSKTNISLEHLKKAIEEVKEDDKEMEIRSRGIVVYRAKENIRAKKPDEGEPSEDEELIKSLLDFLECDEEELQSVNRLGNFSAENIAQGRFRPIKVRFNSKEARDKVLSSLTKLKNAPPELKILSIRQDLNYAQRQELNAKVKEAREKSKDSVNGVYRVRGSPGSYHLVLVKGNNPFLGKAQAAAQAAVN